MINKVAILKLISSRWGLHRAGESMDPGRGKAEWVGHSQPSSISFPMEISPVSVQHPRAPRASRDAHCPDPTLTPSHPLTPKPTDLRYHPCLSHLGPYRFLLVPCLLQLPTNVWLPEPSAGFSHSSLRFSPCLIPIYCLPCPQVWLCCCQDARCRLLCPVLLSQSSNLHFSVPFDLWNPETLQILFFKSRALIWIIKVVV